MELTIGNEPRDDYYTFELTAAALKLVTVVRPVGRGQQVLVSVDSAGDMRAARATAGAVQAVGGVPTLVSYPTLPEPMSEPPRPLAQAALGADVWIDFAVAYQLYSAAYHAAVANGCIYVCLTGMDVDMMVRTIGRVAHAPLEEMARVLYRMSQAAETIRLASPAGTNLRMTWIRKATRSGRRRGTAATPRCSAGRRGRWPIARASRASSSTTGPSGRRPRSASSARLCD